MKAPIGKMLADMGPPDPAMTADAEPDGDEGADDGGDRAAAESAIEDFFAAGKRGDFKAAYDAFHEAVSYCMAMDHGSGE